MPRITIRLIAIAFLATLITIPCASAQTPAAAVEALDGVDPVLLVQGKEIQGKPELKVRRGRFEYLFSTAATREAFEKQPEKYEIQLNGLCARMGKATGGNPADYFVYEGKIYVFGSDECHKKFEADPKKYLPPPVAAMPDSARALAEGRALVERGVKAVGGAARIDAITTYVETATQVQKRPAGDVPLTLKTMWRFPGDVRLERTMTLQGKTMSSATLMTPAGLWYLSQGHAYPGIEAGRPSMEMDYGRQIVPLLHARRDAGFRAAALGSTTIEGTKVDRVRIRNRGMDVTLGLDSATGRIRAVWFVDRNTMDGEYGEFALFYSDYRDVNGLMLPFSERALFNGVAESSLTRTIESIAINTPLDPSLFTPGTAGQ